MLTPSEAAEQVAQARHEARQDRAKLVTRIESLGGKFLELVAMLNDRTVLGAIPPGVRAKANYVAEQTRHELKAIAE